jgi:hypothetical protein
LRSEDGTVNTERTLTGDGTIGPILGKHYSVRYLLAVMLNDGLRHGEGFVRLPVDAGNAAVMADQLTLTLEGGQPVKVISNQYTPEGVLSFVTSGPIPRI